MLIDNDKPRDGMCSMRTPPDGDTDTLEFDFPPSPDNGEAAT
jgi:hypothetical protein